MKNCGEVARLAPYVSARIAPDVSLPFHPFHLVFLHRCPEKFEGRLKGKRQ